MGETNNQLQRFFSDNERFADLINTYAGEDVLKASDLEEKDSLVIAKPNEKKDKDSISKYRDIIRKAAMGMTFILIGVENQMEIHYAMPIRSFVYDAAGYDEQLKKISTRNKKRKDLRGAEFLSGFRKTDKVIPVCTMVLYYGQAPWDGALDLYGLMDLEGIPPAIRKLIHNYPINLIQINTFEGVERFKTDLKAVFGFLQNSQNKDKLMKFIEENRKDFETMDEETYDLIGYLTNAGTLKKVKASYKNEEGVWMCKAIDDLITDGEIRGEKRGEKQGSARMLQLTTAMVKDNLADKIERLSTDESFLKEMLLKYKL